jgi:hypothetical protein
MFFVPTIRFQVLYIFIVLGLERRRLVFANVTANPTAEWLAQRVVNAFPWTPHQGSSSATAIELSCSPSHAE